ncbi:MAG TPA: GGDEF domain-containing protein [Acidimicrobiales bacterium]|nr:GGDEF domain-containing protein [Acidimicrobiales bacterium]
MELPVGRQPRAARVAATVFIAGLPIALFAYFRDPVARAEVPLLHVVGTGVGVALLGLVFLVVPWDRLPPHTILLIAPVAVLAAIAGDKTDHYLRQSTLGLTITLIVLPLWIGLTGQRGMAVLIGTPCDLVLIAYAHSVVDHLPVGELVVQASAAIIMAELFCKQTAREDVHLRALSALSTGFRADMRHSTTWRKQIEQLAHSVLPRARARLWWAAELHRSKISAHVADDELRDALTEAMTARELVVIDDIIVVALTSGAAQVHGVLALEFDTAPDEFTYPVIELLGAQIGAKLDALLEADGLRKSSHTDPLTKVGNRRRADELIRKMQPGDAVLLADLDHFKNVNDSFGHQVGDIILHKFASHLTAAMRGSDTVARYGGEEFVVVLRKPDQPELIANRLLQLWREQNPITTASVGIAVRLMTETPQATLERADEALYRAKNEGRDRVSVAPMSSLRRS